jgi:hypothetical protein
MPILFSHYAMSHINIFSASSGSHISRDCCRRYRHYRRIAAAISQRHATLLNSPPAASAIELITLPLTLPLLPYFLRRYPSLLPSPLPSSSSAVYAIPNIFPPKRQVILFTGRYHGPGRRQDEGLP